MIIPSAFYFIFMSFLNHFQSRELCAGAGVCTGVCMKVYKRMCVCVFMFFFVLFFFLCVCVCVCVC